MPPHPGFIPSSACLRHHRLPVLRRQQLRRQDIPEAAMPGQAAGPAVGGDPPPTLLPTAAVHTTAGRGPFPAAGPAAGLQAGVRGDLFVTPHSGADLAAIAGTCRLRADAPTVIPGATVGREPLPTVAPTDDPPAALRASVGRVSLPTDAPTVVLHTTVGRRPCPTDAPTVVLEATVGRDPFPTVPPTVALTGAMAETVATGQHPTDGLPVAPGPAVGRHRFPTVAPTAVFRATVGGEQVPTLLPTAVLGATVGRDPFPTVPPTAAWQPCLAQPGSNLSRPASAVTSAARIALYTAPVRELVIFRCLKREKTGLTALRRYVLGNNGTSLQREVRATERRFA